MDIFFEIHKDLPREGPGDNRSTQKALALMQNLPYHPQILDIGCGPGLQTLELARRTTGKIVAVDTHQPFLDTLQQRAQAAGLSERISLENASMFALTYQPNSFDALWSEGAIYIIGFEKGLREWRPLLKPGGYVAVTEISWLKPNPPQEVLSYWMADYPDMQSIDANLSRLRAAGYREIDHFTLPTSSWWDDYYTPIQARLPMLRQKYQGDAEAKEILNATEKEIAMYQKYSEWYGYVFYVMQVE